MNDLFFELLKQAFRIAFTMGREYQKTMDRDLIHWRGGFKASPCEQALNEFLKEQFGDGGLFPERREGERRQHRSTDGRRHDDI